MNDSITVFEARRLIERRLRVVGVASPVAEATLLLEAVTGVDRLELLVQPERSLSLEARSLLSEALRRRTNREPLQHILGTAHFYGLGIHVGPDVLVPRPETERLVELVLEAIQGTHGVRLLDVGTGSGAIALALKHERPDAVVMATDIAVGALAVARANATALGLEVGFAPSDLLAAAPVAAFAATADVLVANLPYLPEGDAGGLEPEARADPPSALFAGADGLKQVRRLERQAHRMLKNGALVALELDPRNAAAGLALFRTWREGRTAADLVGRERFVLVRR